MKDIKKEIEEIIEIDAWKEGVSFKDTENKILALIKEERADERNKTFNFVNAVNGAAKESNKAQRKMVDDYKIAEYKAKLVKKIEGMKKPRAKLPEKHIGLVITDTIRTLNQGYNNALDEVEAVIKDE